MNVEPKLLEEGWAGRTQRAALQEIRRRPLGAAVIAFAGPAVGLLSDDFLLCFAMAALSLIGAFFYSARGVRPLKRIVPVATIAITAATIVACLRYRSAAQGLDPGSGLLDFNIALTFTLIGVALLNMASKMLFFPMGVFSMAPVRDRLCSPLAGFLFAEFDITWTAASIRSEEAIEKNIAQLFIAVPAFVAVGMVPLLLPFGALWAYEVYREMFYGPRPQDALAPLATPAAANSAA